MRKLLFLILLAASFNCFSQKKYTIDEIPDPKRLGQDYFVSDPDGILSDVDSINRLITKLELRTKTEIAVVIVKDFDENLDEFDFGIKLFRKWGIGKKGVDNGLLLFASIDRRKYRFITGYGLEGLLPDVKLKHIAERNLVPAFKTQSYDEGIINSLNNIADFLTNPNNEAEIQSLIAESSKSKNEWKDPTIYSIAVLILFALGFIYLKKKASVVPIKKNNKNYNTYDKALSGGCIGIALFVFISFFVWAFIFSFQMPDLSLSSIPIILYVILSLVIFSRYISGLSTLRKNHTDDENFFEAAKELNKKILPLTLLSPLLLLAIWRNVSTRNNLKSRFSPVLDSKNKEMHRIDRDVNVEGKPYLNAGQRKEETLFVYDYDIWESTDKKEHQIKMWPAEKFDSYNECPECNFKTLAQPKVITVKRATYSRTGEGKEIKRCGNCNHEIFIKSVVLAMLVESSSSSSSSGSSSSSSSSSSGSWGGGSSGGGGSGGSW
ncbi:TPM domain-containing protein [Pedobacter aquatilis]|uniref:TPM domain-containing protein n=1 Tax=Pedobacter aquatilis TaxID=351343 RepID=UPI00293099E8|nr:TPM domain-containing protein [Pedobacter aquatilis]